MRFEVGAGPVQAQILLDLPQSTNISIQTYCVRKPSVSIHESIKNNLPLFLTRTKSIPNIKQQTSNLKSDCNLFGQLYIASMFCGRNLEEFLSHENHSWPPALSNYGRLYLPTKKSDLLNQLIVGDPVLAPLFNNAKIFYGAAIVHALPTQVSTFGE